MSSGLTPSAWSFSVQEVSTGVYCARGADSAGRSVEAKGADPEALLEACKRAAAQMAGGQPPATRSSITS